MLVEALGTLNPYQHRWCHGVNTTSVTMWNYCFGWIAPRRCCLYATSKREVEQLVCYLKSYSTNANAIGFQHKGRLFVESTGERHGWVWVQLTQPQPSHCVPRAGIKPLTFSRWGDSAKHCTAASPWENKALKIINHTPPMLHDIC